MLEGLGGKILNTSDGVKESGSESEVLHHNGNMLTQRAALAAWGWHWYGFWWLMPLFWVLVIAGVIAVVLRNTGCPAEDELHQISISLLLVGTA